MDKLKPCPFCGEEARLDGTGTYSIILCSNCGAKSKRVNISREYCADEKAAEAWNRRTDNVQEVKHGRWTETFEHLTSINGERKEWVSFYCSECNVPNDAPTNYCPHCGTRMDGE